MIALFLASLQPLLFSFPLLHQVVGNRYRSAIHVVSLPANPTTAKVQDAIIKALKGFE